MGEGRGKKGLFDRRGKVSMKYWGEDACELAIGEHMTWKLITNAMRDLALQRGQVVGAYQERKGRGIGN